MTSALGRALTCPWFLLGRNHVVLFPVLADSLSCVSERPLRLFALPMTREGGPGSFCFVFFFSNFRFLLHQFFSLCTGKASAFFFFVCLLNEVVFRVQVPPLLHKGICGFDDGVPFSGLDSMDLYVLLPVAFLYPIALR